MNAKRFLRNLCGAAAAKIVLAIISVVVVVIILAIILVPVYVSSDSGNKLILEKANASGAGKMNYASLSMGWFKGLTIKDFSFNDVNGIANVQIKQISTKPYYGSLLSGNLAFGQTVIEQPVVELNVTNPKPSAAKEKQEKKQPSEMPVKRIDLLVENGDVKVFDKRTNAQGQPVELSNINSEVHLRPAGSRSSFSANMMLAQAGAQSKIAVDGNVTPPRSGWSLEQASGDIEVDINELNLNSLLPLLAMAGVNIQAQGNLSAKFTGKVDNGKIQNLDGFISGRKLSISGPSWKGDRLATEVLDVKVKITGEKNFLNINPLQMQTDWLNANVKGIIPMSMSSLDDYFKPESQYSVTGDFDFDAGKVMAMMPHMLSIREGTKVNSGHLKGNIDTVSEAGRKSIRMQANLTGLAGIVDNKQVTLPAEMNLDAQVSSNKGMVVFDKVNVTAPFVNLNCSGILESLKYSAGANLSQLQEQLGQFVSFGKYKMAGEFRTDGQLSVEKEKTSTIGSAAIRNLQLSTTDGTTASEPQADIKYEVVYESNRKETAIKNFNLDAGFGKLNVKDSVIPSDLKAGTMKLTAAASNIDLAKLQPFMVIFASFPKEMQIAGLANSQVNVTSKKDAYRVKSDSTSIKNLNVSYPNQQPFQQQEVTLNFDAEINPVQQTISVKTLQLTSPQIKIKGNFEKSVEGNNGKLEGQANLDYDWAAISTLAAPYLPKGMQIKGHRNDTVKFSSTYPKNDPNKMLANLNASAKVGFEQANLMGLVFGPTDVNMLARNGVMMISPFSAPVNNGKLNFAAEADFKKKPTFLKTPSAMKIAQNIQITDQMSKQLMAYVNPLFANALNVSGAISFDCNNFALPLVGGTKNDIVIIGTISGAQIKLGSSDLLGQILSATGSGGGLMTLHPTRFALQNGFLRYDNMQIDIGKNPINFQGAIGLDKTLNMNVTLPPGVGGKSMGGQGGTASRITVPLVGTVDKPKLDLGKLLQLQIQKGAEQELQKSLEGLFKKK